MVKKLIDSPDSEYNENMESVEYRTLMEKHKKKLERLSKKNQKNLTVGTIKIAGECARRMQILRRSLNLTVVEMSNVCNLNPSKYNRLESGITQLPKSDAIGICIAVLAKYNLVIDVEWLLGKTHQTPPSLLNLAHVQKKVEEYTNTFLNDNVDMKGINSTVSIFLEMEQLGRIHPGAKFIMVNDNRLLPQYQKGDYVGAMNIPRNLWYLLKGHSALVELKVDKKVSVRNVNLVEQESNGIDYILLSTNTREPEIKTLDEIESIAIIFYHRHNGENIIDILELIKKHQESSN